MTMRRSIISASACALACVSLVAMQAQRQDAAGGPSGGQDATQAAAAGWRRPARWRRRGRRSRWLAARELCWPASGARIRGG